MEDLGSLTNEQVIIVFLDNRLRFLGDEVLCIGTVNSCPVSVREILSLCLHKNCVSFIMIHNHPSGNPTPGKEDLHTTKRIKEGAALVELNFTDHIVIGDNCYYSFREQGLI